MAATSTMAFIRKLAISALAVALVNLKLMMADYQVDSILQMDQMIVQNHRWSYYQSFQIVATRVLVIILVLNVIVR